MGGGPGAMVGASASVEGFGAVWGSGAVGGPASGRATVSSDGRSSLSRASSSARRAGGLLGDIAQIVLDARSGPCSPVGLESPADLINAAGQVDVQAVEVVAGSVAHHGSVLGSRSIGCSPPEPACCGQTTKTHFEEDVRFACDCDIAFAIWESAGLCSILPLGLPLPSEDVGGELGRARQARASITSASCRRIKNSWRATASHAGVLPNHPRPIVPSAFRNQLRALSRDWRASATWPS